MHSDSFKWSLSSFPDPNVGDLNVLKENTEDDGGDDLTLHSLTSVHDFN